MRPITRREALLLTEPLHEPFMDFMDSGWQRWLEFERTHPDWRRSIDKSSRANMVHNWITEAAGEYLRGRDGVIWIAPPKSRLRIARIGNAVNIKFKKSDKSGRVSGISTQAFDLFQGQGDFFPDISGINLNAVYVLDASESRIIGKFLVCPQGKGKRWVHDLRLPAPRVADTDGTQRLRLDNEDEEGMAVAL